MPVPSRCAMSVDHLKKAEAAIRERALAFPQAREEFPWGHSAFKVKGKTFLFLSLEKTGRLGLSLKLPETGTVALLSTFARPTEYGLGKSGWVSASFGEEDEVPLDLMFDWIEESFRAIAPQKVVDQLDAGGLENKKTPKQKEETEDRRQRTVSVRPREGPARNSRAGLVPATWRNRRNSRLVMRPWLVLPN